MKLPTEETHYFDYAWPPFTQSPCDLRWMGLAEHQVTYPHIQVCKRDIEREGEREREGGGEGGRGEGGRKRGWTEKRRKGVIKFKI